MCGVWQWRRKTLSISMLSFCFFCRIIEQILSVCMQVPCTALLPLLVSYNYQSTHRVTLTIIDLTAFHCDHKLVSLRNTNIFVYSWVKFQILKGNSFSLQDAIPRALLKLWEPSKSLVPKKFSTFSGPAI